MGYNLTISLEAEQDIETAYCWYEDQKEELGYDFLNAVNIAFRSILANPLLYGFHQNDLRRYTVKRFPYVVIYHIEDDAILIVSVFHTSKRV